MPFHHRPFRTEDFTDLVGMARDAWRLGGPHEYPPGQLCWELARLTPGDEAMLCFSERDELAGFCVAYPGSDIGEICHPKLGDAALEHEMFEWAEGVFAGVSNPVIACCERQPGRKQVLEARGYRVQGPCIAVTEQSLQREIPEPVLPEGFRIADLRSVSVEDRVTGQRAAFVNSRTTVAMYEALQQTPVYDPEHDVVALAPDGSVAAFAIAWVDWVNRHGLFEPVGTHPDYRGMGLGKAVLNAGLRRMVGEGCLTAQVGHHHDAEAARRLYESVGFKRVDLWTRYEKK